MATVPLSGTNIRLLSGIPFSNDYKHTRWFDNSSSQTSYFLGKPVVHSMAQANFQRIDGYHFIAVNKSIDDLWNTNYVMFQNAQYNSKWFYGFVTKLEYVQKNTTYVHFQIDVFQTWKFEMNFKPSFVIREHCKLWNADGTPVINTIDEGLDYGSEYDNIAVDNYKLNGGYKWLVIVTTKTMHDDGGESGAMDQVVPTVIGTPQPLSYYLVPFKDDDMTPSVVLKDGSDVPISPPTKVLEQLYKDEKAVNNIVCFYVTEYTGIACEYSAGQDNMPDVITFPDNKNEVVGALLADSVRALYVKKVASFSGIEEEFQADKYVGFTKPKESKLLMYPYCSIVLDDYKGNRVTYKPEYIEGKPLKLMMKGSLGTSNKTTLGIPDYNFNAPTNRIPSSNEFAMVNNKPYDVPIINDYLAAFMQGNRNSIQNQFDSIFFNGMMSIFSGGIAGANNINDPMAVAQAGTGIVSGGGNAVLQMQGIEAKKQDIANLPPQLSKMGSNTAYDIGNGYNGVYVIKKQIKPEYRKKLSDFFNAFGYKMNEIKMPNFHTRRYWNYVQTASCVITGNFNNEDLTELKSVFDNGITLWHTDDIGNYALDNEVIA